jgi:hypothetical protein
LADAQAGGLGVAIASGVQVATDSRFSKGTGRDRSSQGGTSAEVPPVIDVNKPSVARVYDMLLGGKDTTRATG